MSMAADRPPVVSLSLSMCASVQKAPGRDAYSGILARAEVGLRSPVMTQ